MFKEMCIHVCTAHYAGYIYIFRFRSRSDQIRLRSSSPQVAGVRAKHDMVPVAALLLLFTCYPLNSEYM